MSRSHFFKASVFTEFTSHATTIAFLSASPPPTFEGAPLLVMSKEDYCAMKIKEKGLTGKAADMRKSLYSSGRKFDAFREMTSAKKTGGSKGAAEKEGDKEVFLEFMGTTIPIERGEDGVGQVKEADIPFVKGATLRFEGVDTEAKVMFNDIKVSFRWCSVLVSQRDLGPFERKVWAAAIHQARHRGLFGTCRFPQGIVRRGDSIRQGYCT
jgi:hypothetical protein